MMQKKNLIKDGEKRRGKLYIMCEVEPNQHADLKAFGRKGAGKSYEVDSQEVQSFSIAFKNFIMIMFYITHSY